MLIIIAVRVLLSSQKHLNELNCLSSSSNLMYVSIIAMVVAIKDSLDEVDLQNECIVIRLMHFNYYYICCMMKLNEMSN